MEEDNLLWKRTFDGRQDLIKDDLLWNACTRHILNNSLNLPGSSPSDQLNRVQFAEKQCVTRIEAV